MPFRPHRSLEVLQVFGLSLETPDETSELGLAGRHHRPPRRCQDAIRHLGEILVELLDHRRPVGRATSGIDQRDQAGDAEAPSQSSASASCRYLASGSTGSRLYM
jgi:hypothetical protein